MPRSDTARYLYTAWFRDTLALPDDEDVEWPACFLVVAENEANAQTWGDHLSTSFSRRRGTEEFLRSSVEPSEDGGRLPVVKDGEDASDGEIGW
jgi:hypothetical protein